MVKVGGRTIGRRIGGFTLIELLVVVAIISLLIAILFPALSAARKRANVTKCLSNIRSLSLASWVYLTENDGWLIDVGLAHGTAQLDTKVAWVNTLEAAYGHSLIVRSPLDDSPYWDPNLGGDGTALNGPIADPNQAIFRRTSYGMNNVLTRAAAVFDPVRSDYYRFDRIERIPRSADVVEFVFMAKEGDFAASDHTHIENWQPGPLPATAAPRFAAREVQIDAVDGPAKSFQASSNYGFVDGHAATKEFGDVYRDYYDNNFWPVPPDRP